MKKKKISHFQCGLNNKKENKIPSILTISIPFSPLWAFSPAEKVDLFWNRAAVS